MELALPYPPSYNGYWRHTSRGHYLTPAARRYRKAVADVTQGVYLGAGPLGCDIVAFPPDRRKRDLDNILKATLDAMEHAGVYRDDSQIKRLSLCWGERRQGGSLSVVLTDHNETAEIRKRVRSVWDRLPAEELAEIHRWIAEHQAGTSGFESFDAMLDALQKTLPIFGRMTVGGSTFRNYARDLERRRLGGK